MAAVKQVYLLLICQGFYLGSVCQRWDFPSTITALIGSCVEIPCIYDPAGISGTSSPVWYLYARSGYPEILNTKDSSSVIEEYKARTSLVPGNNSCTLRIDPVRREDTGRYYPGIAEDRKIHAFTSEDETVNLSVTDKVEIQLQGSELMTEREASIIRCLVSHTCGSNPPSLQWNKPGQVKNESVNFFGLFWIEHSELTYIPSYVDDGTPVQCTATYPNGQKNAISRTLNISYAATEVHITVEKERGFTALICDFQSSRPPVTHYTWMKDGSILPNETGKTLTVYNNVENYQLYSCIAHNTAGNSFSKEIYHKDEESRDSFRKSHLQIILPTTIGAICLLLLVLLVSACWRKRQKKLTSTETEDTYTDLRTSDITSIYHQLQPGIPLDTTFVRSDAAHNYENVPKQKL